MELVEVCIGIKVNLFYEIAVEEAVGFKWAPPVSVDYYDCYFCLRGDDVYLYFSVYLLVLTPLAPPRAVASFFGLGEPFDVVF